MHYDLGARIKEEREKAGLSQPQLAEIADTSKRTVISWEQGKTSPSAVQLSSLSEVGIDVAYIITGQCRSQIQSPISQQGINQSREFNDFGQQLSKLVQQFETLKLQYKVEECAAQYDVEHSEHSIPVYFETDEFRQVLIAAVEHVILEQKTNKTRLSSEDIADDIIERLQGKLP